MEKHRLPFSITEVYGGFVRIDGILIVEEEHLLFEYQMADNMVGAVRGKIQTRKVRYQDIEAVESKTGWFSTWIEFRAKSLRTFDKFPQKDGANLKIAIEKKHRKRMDSALSEIELQRSYIEADRFLNKDPRKAAGKKDSPPMESGKKAPKKRSSKKKASSEA